MQHLQASPSLIACANLAGDTHKQPLSRVRCPFLQDGKIAFIPFLPILKCVTILYSPLPLGRGPAALLTIRF